MLHSLPDHHTPDSTDDEDEEDKENDQATPPGDKTQNGSSQLPHEGQNGSSPHLNVAQNGISRTDEDATQNGSPQGDASPEQEISQPEPVREETDL